MHDFVILFYRTQEQILSHITRNKKRCQKSTSLYHSCILQQCNNLHEYRLTQADDDHARCP